MLTVYRHTHKRFWRCVAQAVAAMGFMGAITVCLAASDNHSSTTSSAESCTVIKAPIYHAQTVNDDAYYFTRLLTLALDLSVEEFGPYCLEEPAAYFLGNRLKASLQQGQVDLMWLATSQEDERQMQAIPIPLLGELNHYRLLLIRADQAPSFAKVETLKDLQAFTGVMNPQWADAKVLAENDLPYVAVAGYWRLFRMLAGGRVDYFSRGIFQATAELERLPDLGLMVEPHLLLKYPNFTYFFVRKGDQQLADRIALGLKKAQQNGQFEALFQSIPRFRWAQKQLHSGNRTVLQLERRWSGY